MPVRFVIGPAGSGKTEHCLSRLRSLERAGSPGIFLVPEQYTYTADRELLDSGAIAGLRHVRVLSFTRLALWLREMFSRPQPPALPREIRPLILRLVMQEMPAEQIAPLLPLRRRSGFLEELGQFVGEMRNHGAAGFLDAVRRGEGVSDKVLALANVYEHYTVLLRRQGRIDPEQMLDGLEPLIAEHAAIVSKWTFFVDGFLSWTRREREILAALALAGAPMEVTFCLDADSGESGCRYSDSRESDSRHTTGPRTPFIPVSRSLRRLRRSLAAAGIPLLDDLCMEPPASRRSGFERRLFVTTDAVKNPTPARGCLSADTSPGREDGNPGAESSTPLPEIAIQPARDPRQEVILWARQIDRWIRIDPDPVPPGKVAVILRRVDPYRDLIREIFPRYHIPYFLDERRGALVHPRVRLLLEALEVCLSGWRRDNVVTFLRNPLLGIPPATLDLLENLSLEYGRDFEAWLDTEWEEFVLVRRERSGGLKDHDDAEDERDEQPDSAADEEDVPGDERETDGRMAFVEHVRRAALAPVRDLQHRWDEASGVITGTEAVAAVREMLDALDSFAGQSAAGSTCADGSPSAPCRIADPEPDWTESVQAALDRILLEMEKLWSGVEAGLDEFARSLVLALRSVRIGMTPLRLNQVVVGDVQRSRLHGIECAVVGGMNDGEFPRTAHEDSVLAGQDRRYLEQVGVSLGPTAEERQEEEVYLFYIGLTRAGSRMLLTWRQSDADGKAAEPSLLMEEVIRAIPERPGIPPSPSPGKEAQGAWQTPEELAEDAVTAVAEGPADSLPDPRILALYRQLRTPHQPEGLGAGDTAGPDPALSNIRGSIALSLPALLYTPRPVLPAPVLERLFPHSDMESSVSRLQGFSRCPFQSYARALLRLEPRPRARISPLETGTLAHDALERFFQGRLDPDPLAVERRLNRIFEGFKGHPGYRAFEVDEASRYRKESTRNSLRRFLELEVARLAGSPYRPAATEVSFSRRDGTAVQIRMPGGNRLLLNGRIDRLDIAEAGGVRRALVLDYKRSQQTGLPKAIEEGFDLQLAVYLLYIQDVLGWEPAGGLYLPVLPGPVAAERMRTRRHNTLGVRAHGIVLDSEWEAVDAGSGLLAENTRSNTQVLPDADRLQGLLDIARQHLAAFAQSQRLGWMAARPLEHPPGRLPCDYCDYGAVCRFRPGRDPVRRKPREGMTLERQA